MSRSADRDAGGAGRAPLRLAWDRRLLDYRFGPDHPFDQRSRALAVELLRASLEPEERGAVESVPPVEPADEALLTAFHRPEYLERVRDADRAGDGRLLDRGDTPSFPGCFAASARIVAATAGAVQEGLDDGRWSLAPAGGLHHAAAERASGFCVFNDLAVAIAAALRHGRKVAYLDLDAHHGDGVMYGFYEDGRLLDLDVHQDGRTLFPGTGALRETGAGDGAGLKVNLPLPPGTGDEALVPLLRRVVPPLLEEFRPALLLVQHGVDGHWGDPLAQLQYTARGYDAVDRLVVDQAARLGIPLVVTGGGGYRPASVARTLARAGRAIARLPLPASEREVPAAWRGSFAATFGGAGPTTWADRPRLAPSPWSSERTDATVRELEEHLGRKFPPEAPERSARGEG